MLGLKILPWLIGIRGFITDGSQPQNTEADHAQVDNVLIEEEEEAEAEKWRKARRRWRDGKCSSEPEPGTSSAVETPDETGQEGEPQPVRSEPAGSNAVANPDQTIQPFFPVGLALSEDQPTVFNFGLYLFDTLRLPKGLFQHDNTGPVEFDDLASCRTYCERFVQHAEENLPRATHESQADRRPQFEKSTMFAETGTALGDKMTTSLPAFDKNLQQLRVDQFGNVMALFAPSWSDISVQYTHGYPRRLVSDSHGGMVEGNLIVAARITNQAIRSLAVGDIAGFLSKEMICGLGLTTSELMLARSTALRYAGKSEKPARLVELMFRFGIDFLYFTPLSSDQLQSLQETTSHLRDNIFSLESGDSDSCSSEDSREIQLPWVNPSTERATLPERSHDAFAGAVAYHLNHLLSSYLSRPAQPHVDHQPPPPEVSVASTSSPSSGQRKKRRKKDPRRVDSTSAQPSTDADAAAQGEQAEPPADEADARQLLLALPRIVPARIPNPESLASLTQYMAENEPVLPSLQLRNAVDHHRFVVYQDAQASARQTCVKEQMQRLWDVCKKNCVCLGQPTTRGNSQGSRHDENCPYNLIAEEGGEVHTARSACLNTNCLVCAFINKLDVRELTEVGVRKNQRLTLLLGLSPHIAVQYLATDLSEEERKTVHTALSLLLSCGSSRLRNIANVGYLTQHCPNLPRLQLIKGWGNFWNNMSKFGTAVGYQVNEENQLAVLLYLRHTCLSSAPDSNWHHYLETEDTAEEETVLRRVFPGCFEQTRDAGENVEQSAME